jgi:hypothetical protein
MGKARENILLIIIVGGIILYFANADFKFW